MTTKRVLVHVGTPKTGTSYFQDVLFRNRELLRESGILYPAERFDAQFLAALDLMRLPWGGLEADAVGAWERLAGEVRDFHGTAIISHEILATATRAQADRALASLGHEPGGHGRGPEVHLVLSVRDLVRQIPAEWQENVKHRSTASYARFLEMIRDPERQGRIPTWFWAAQEIPDILSRWGHSLPPERVHLVTVPAPGAPRDLLWQRFSTVFGLDGLELDMAADRSNPSMGAPETTFIRRLNRAVNRVVEPADYRPLVRELLAHQTLSRRTTSPRLALPPQDHPWAQEVADRWIQAIEERGYDVVGDLADLRGGPPAEDYTDPDRPRERLVSAAALDATRALLLENARLRQSEERLVAELSETRQALERAHLRPSYRLRERIVHRLDASRTGAVLMRVYRRARGRSSLSA
ncbi:hypothetical protein [Nocardioides pacificus]